MSLVTPTTSEINANIIAQLEASLNETLSLLPKSFNRVLAKALAGVFILLYKYAGFTALQTFVKTASGKDTVINGVIVNPLRFWGRLVGVGDPTPATFAELTVDVTVTNQVGSLPAGTQLIYQPTGVTYITIGSVALTAATVSATVRAASDQSGGGGAGTIGNLGPGVVLSFANPLPNVDRSATVTAQTVTGADAEDVEVYRERIEDRFQKRPQGGAYADYEQWGEEAAGVLHVYPYTGTPGEVDLYCEATVASSGSPDGIPTAAQLQAVLDLVNYNNDGLANRRNANAFVNVYPITRTGFDVTIVGISGVDDLAAVQADLTETISEYFLAVEPFIAGLSVPPKNDQITRTRVSALAEDVITAAGGTFTSARFNLTGIVGTLDSYILGEGEKAKVANMAFI